VTSAGPRWLDQRLAAGEIVIIDGGVGTELEARGAVMDEGAWCGPANLEAGGLLRQIHSDYIAAGADVVIANTFAAGRQALEPSGFGGQVVEINRRAVEYAVEARDRAEREVAVAGAISHFIAPDAGAEWRQPERLAACFREQAETQAEAGADLIALEMMQRLEYAEAAMAAAQTTGLPVWLGLCAQRGAAGDGYVSFAEPPYAIEPMFAAAGRLGAGLVTVMHSDVDVTAALLDLLQPHWSGPTGVYPESGYFEMPHWQFIDIISPADLAVEAERWIAAGCQVIGGCCGIGVAHIAKLKQALPSHLPGRQSES
jgi:homocysteine S-methyltransferase